VTDCRGPILSKYSVVAVGFVAEVGKAGGVGRGKDEGLLGEGKEDGGMGRENGLERSYPARHGGGGF